MGKDVEDYYSRMTAGPHNRSMVVPARAFQHEVRRKERHERFATADLARPLTRPATAHSSHLDLLGPTRVERGSTCLLRIWGDRHKPMERIDLPLLGNTPRSSGSRSLSSNPGSSSVIPGEIEHKVLELCSLHSPENASDQIIQQASLPGSNDTLNFHSTSDHNRTLHKSKQPITQKKSSSSNADDVIINPERLTHVGCGSDHFVWLRNGKAWGIGNNWDGQITKNWTFKPKQSLINFSRPVRVQIHNPDHEHGEETSSSHERVEGHSTSTGEVCAIAAYLRTTCIAYENEVEWHQRPGIVIRLPMRARIHSIALRTSKALFLTDQMELLEATCASAGPTCKSIGKGVEKIGATSSAFYYTQDGRVQTTDGSVIHDMKEPIAQLACGDFHVLILLKESKRLMALGSNTKGALGLSHSTKLIGGDFGTPQLVNSRLSPFWHKCEFIAEVCAEGGYSAALLEDGRVFVWGEMVQGAMTLRPQQMEIPDFVRPRKLWPGRDYIIVEGQAKPMSP